MTFRAPLAGVLRRVRLDAMTAIYDRRSGATHLVAEVVPVILDALGEGAADIDTLLARLLGPPVSSDKFSQAGRGERAALADRLDELVTTGLIERG